MGIGELYVLNFSNYFLLNSVTSKPIPNNTRESKVYACMQFNKFVIALPKI